jgi:dipeptidyl aminopeptidase/acylaminoacyl peptidase
MTDLAVEYGTERADINAYDTWYLGTPYENQDDFIRMSPMTHIKNARTPALILIGEEDEIDPIGQSRQFYRGLKRYDVETELVIYPREPHRIKERSHRIDLLTRMTGWIEIYTR